MGAGGLNSATGVGGGGAVADVNGITRQETNRVGPVDILADGMQVREEK